MFKAPDSILSCAFQIISLYLPQRERESERGRERKERERERETESTF